MSSRAMTIALGLALMAGSACAQDSNPNSAAYHALHNSQSPSYVGPRQTPVQPPPRLAGYWEKTWGAIAPSPAGGAVGSALGASSKEEAERRALADCKQKGGRACQIGIAYHNQCGVMAVGEKKFFTASAGSEAEAKTYGLETCKKEDANCRIYYSACTEPKFHRY